MRSSAGVSAAVDLGRTHAPWLLVVAFVVLLPAEPLFNVPLLVAAAAGLVALVRDRTVVAHPAWRTAALVYACVVVPMVVALPDAVDPGESARKAASFALLPLAAGWLGVTLGPRGLHRVLVACYLVATAWGLDTVVQLVAGRDVFGFPYDGDGRLTGVFHPQFSLGIVLASLAPLWLEGARRLSAAGRLGTLAWIGVPACLAGIALSGSRASWLTLLLALTAFVGHRLLAGEGRALLRPALLAAAVAGLVAVGGAMVVPGAAERASALVAGRVTSATGLLDADRQRIDAALSYRLSIWETAVDVFRSHAFNGVGPRGFRDVYAEHAGPDDFWMARDPNRLPTHPHQLALEIAAETGGVGVVGYLALLAVVGWRALGALRARCDAGVAAWVAVGLALLPINAHMAFYGNVLSSLNCVLIAIALGAWPGRLGPSETTTRATALAPRSD